MKILNLVFEVLVHMIFMLIVLFIAFLAFISKQESDAFSKELDNITKYVSQVLDIPAILLVPFKEEIQIYYQRTSEKISSLNQQNNNYLKLIMIIVIVSFFLLIAISYLIFRFGAKEEIEMGKILISNTILIIFVGAFEIYFFVKVASQYPPIVPSDLMNPVYDTFKNPTTTTIFLFGDQK